MGVINSRNSVEELIGRGSLLADGLMVEGDTSDEVRIGRNCLGIAVIATFTGITIPDIVDRLARQDLVMLSPRAIGPAEDLSSWTFVLFSSMKQLTRP